MARPKRQAGLSWIEFSVAVAVLALIWMAALNRLLDLQEMGERTVVEMTVSNINSGLRLEMAERIMTAREASIVELAGGNPVRWLEEKPGGYLGEFPSAPDGFRPGYWYFDTAHKYLRYWPKLERYLECWRCERAGGEIVLSWHIEKADNPMFGRGSHVKMVPVTPYRWF